MALVSVCISMHEWVWWRRAEEKGRGAQAHLPTLDVEQLRGVSALSCMCRIRRPDTQTQILAFQTDMLSYSYMKNSSAPDFSKYIWLPPAPSRNEFILSLLMNIQNPKICLPMDVSLLALCLPLPAPVYQSA